MSEVVDGEFQKYTVEAGGYIREHFFGKYPELLELVEHLYRRAAPQAAPRRPRPGEGLRRLQGGRRAQGLADGHPGQDRQGLRPGRGGRGQERHPPAEEAQRGGAARVPQPLRHPDLRRGASPRRRSTGRPTTARRCSTCRSAGRRWAASCRRGGCKTEPLAGPRARRRSRSFFEGSDRERLDDHGVRRHADAAAEGQGDRQAGSCRSSPTRRAPSAWSRCSASSRSTPTSASSTSRSTRTMLLVLPRGEGRPDPRRGHHRGRARCRRSSPPAPPTPRTACRRSRSSSTTRCSASSGSAT